MLRYVSLLRRNGHNANIIDVFFGIEDKAAETFFNDNGNDLEKIAADMKKKRYSC